MEGFLAEKWKLKKVINISKTQMCCFLRDTRDLDTLTWYLKSQMTNFRLNLYTFKKWYSSKAVTITLLTGSRIPVTMNLKTDLSAESLEQQYLKPLCILAVFTEKHLYYSEYSIVILANTVSIPVCLPKFTFTVHSPTDPMS